MGADRPEQWYPPDRTTREAVPEPGTSRRVDRRTSEPRWPALMAAIAVGILYYVIPSQLTVGPGWLLFVLTTGLFAASYFFHRTSSVQLNEGFSYAGMAVITLALVASLSLLIMRLPNHKDQPVELLRAAGALWVSNILVFASWYWRLDGGGPNERDKRGVMPIPAVTHSATWINRIWRGPM
jgi:hypothetical protein